MKFSIHAKTKLEIYGISESAIIDQLKSDFEEFYDKQEETYIRVITLGEILLAIVCDYKKEKIITIYRTDNKTIINRQKNKRWL